MSNVKLHSNLSSNSFGFENDADMPYELSSSGSSCSVYVDTDDFFGLGPYDLPESRTKMSGGASPSSALPKKKKKNDDKGESQLNKRINEKRRREQENIYIEELAELISASFADMSSLSVKPDKCAILQETVKQVRAGTHRFSSEQTADNLINTEAAVQQGEVSSSKPTRISNTELAPLLLSALDGFLFVVNPDSQIEFVTENIQQFLHYNKEELIGKSVYNIIHHGDHTKFNVLLNNPLLIYNHTSIGSPASSQPTTPLMEQSPSGSEGNNWNQRFTTKFNCRLLIKPPSDQDQTIEEKLQRVSKYETLQISSTKINGGMVDDEESSDGNSQNLLCIARRVAFNEKHLSPPLEQFTIKLDQNGEILALDTKDVSEVYAQHINKDALVGKLLHDKCHKNDVCKVVNHLQETRRAGFNTSPIYRLHLIDDSYVNVQTKSKYFKSNDKKKIDFIMAAHSIIGDSEMCAMIENNAARAAADTLNASLNGNDSSLMACNVGSNQSISSLQSETKFCSDFNMTQSTDLNFSDFGLFPSTTFGDIMQENKWSESSTNSIEAPSKITPVPSPATVSSNPHTPVAQTQYTSFPFSPLIPSPKDSYESSGSVERMESVRLRSLLTTKRTDSSSDENNLSKNKHNILKGLLNPDEMATQSVDDGSTNQSTPSSPANIRQTSRNNTNLNDSPTTPNNATTSNNNNNMLLKLLNDKSQDEDIEDRAGLKKQNYLLQQLLKNDDNVRQHARGIMLEQNDQHSNEDLLLNSMGLRILSPTSPDSHNNGRKRNSLSAENENDHPPLKRSHSTHSSCGSSSSGPSVLESLSSPSGSQTQVTNSKLREKNKMLASLLAKDPPPTAIPAIPASVISATPQDKLVTIIKQQQQQQQQQQQLQLQQQQQQQHQQQQQQQQQQSVVSWNSGQHSMNLPQNIQANQHQSSHQRILQQKSGNNLFVNHMLDQPQATQSQNQIATQQQMRLVTSSGNSSYSAQLINITESNINSLPFNSDPELSELLEEVMDIMNVNSVTDNSSSLNNFFNVLETTSEPDPIVPNTGNQDNPFDTNEKRAVNAIQKSLMLVESSVKSPVPPPPMLQLTYGSQTGSIVPAQNQFLPPPAYQPQQKPLVRFNPQHSSRIAGVPPYPKNVQTPPLQQQQLLLQHQQQKQRLIQQQQQKQRLLQLQQQQKIMVVTTNAASIATPDPTSGLQTIDSLLNNTGPPNVALQRSSSVPDSQSQLSPVYAASGSQLLNNSSQISPSSSRQPPYSSITQQSFSMLNYGTTTQTTSQSQQIVQQTASRMSPSTHSQYQNPINPCVSQQQQTQSIYISQAQQSGVWNQQRLTLHQQQNPMLNAQLQIPGGFNNSSVRQNFINQQQNHGPNRVLTSPVGYNSEVPPNTNCQPPQQQQFRLPRNMNMTSSSPHIPGGNNGVTEYTRNELRAFVGVRSQQGSTRMTSQLLPGQNVTPGELDPLGLNFDMSPTGGNESPKWSGLNSDLGSSSPQPQGISTRNPIDDSTRSSSANSTTNVTDQKSSLLQKLLSEKII